MDILDSYGKALANIASIFILGIGIIAALNQVDIATTVTTPTSSQSSLPWSASSSSVLAVA
ncbi:hypothetical protein M1D93_09375 [Arthrobacter sp. Z1-9]